MSLTVGRGPFGKDPAGRFNVEVKPPGALLFWDPVDYRVRALLGGKTVLDSRGVKAGQLILDFGDRTDGPKDRPQPIAECLLVGDRQRRSGEYPLAAVRLDQRDIDPVERSAAHQSESAPHMRGALWPPLGTYVR